MLATLAVTGGSIATAVALAPHAPDPSGRLLTSLLFVGSSIHVAATGGLLLEAEVRGHASSHRPRYLHAPVALVVAGAISTIILPATIFEWLLLVFFAWQFEHFQRQNLGLAALAASSHRVAALDASERRALLLAGRAATVAIVARPALLGLVIDPFGALSPVAGAMFLAAAAWGARSVLERPPSARPAAVAAMYAMTFLFWLPVFVFRSPYAAIGGIVIAHGLQYLVLVGLVARDRWRRAVIVLGAGIVLNALSHLHTNGAATRWLYGAYLGLVAAHFVVDAGLWRLRDRFARDFLAGRLPYLVPAARSVTDLGSVQ